VVSTHGSGVGRAWDALRQAFPAGRDWTPPGVDTPFFAAPLPDDYQAHAGIPSNVSHFLDRGAAMALDAALQALASAGLGAGAGDARRFAVADGLGFRAPGQATLFVPYGHVIARALGVRGPVLSFGGAEASGMEAVIGAVRLVARGEADVVIAGAAQSLQAPVLTHLAEQGAMAGAAAMPFDQRHAGLVPAEGAAYFVIESEAHARGRGANPLATIAGTGDLFDSAAEPLAMADAGEAGRGIQITLSDAGFLQNQVDLVVSCADGRPAVDFVDGFGILRTFGRHVYYADVTTVAASLGHALAASGPLSLALAIEALNRQQVFPIAGLDVAEQGLELAYVREAREERLDCVLVTSMGLGGTVAGVLLQRPALTDHIR